jgi:hypothetical protein
MKCVTRHSVRSTGTGFGPSRERGNYTNGAAADGACQLLTAQVFVVGRTLTFQFRFFIPNQRESRSDDSTRTGRLSSATFVASRIPRPTSPFWSVFGLAELAEHANTRSNCDGLHATGVHGTGDDAAFHHATQTPHKKGL